MRATGALHPGAEGADGMRLHITWEQPRSQRSVAGCNEESPDEPKLIGA
ncbi:MAG TPA: hypothetical protein VIV60_36475 [Polyangiaceae bacterium]